MKAGFNYRFNGMHNVFVNGGYVTKAPMMDNIFVDNTPLSNPIPEKKSRRAKSAMDSITGR